MKENTVKNVERKRLLLIRGGEIVDEKLHPHQVKGINRDKSKKAYITKVDNGSWTLLNFWESDIKKNVLKCVDKIEIILNKR